MIHFIGKTFPERHSFTESLIKCVKTWDISAKWMETISARISSLFTDSIFNIVYITVNIAVNSNLPVISFITEDSNLVLVLTFFCSFYIMLI